MAFDIRAVLSSIKRIESGEVIEDIGTHGAGYRIDTDGVRGASLLSPKQYGYQLVARIKDSEPFLWDEARFWGRQLVRIVEGITFDCVTHPPSSRKRDEHLATVLSQEVATEMGLPYAALFTNATPRGRRASTVAKLKEVKQYGYDRKPDGAKVLVVDDVMQTRSTAKACLAACGSDQLFFLILYRA